MTFALRNRYCEVCCLLHLIGQGKDPSFHVNLLNGKLFCKIEIAKAVLRDRLATSIN